MTVENFNKTKIKICGLRRREDILAVNEAKPDYCGFIIEFPKSIRSVTADEVRELVNDLSPDIQPVGVFVNAPMELVKALMDEGTFAMAQLHGQENESYITELKAHTDKPVIKAFSIKTADDMENALQSPADYILLDQGSGGTAGAGDPGNSSLCGGFKQQCRDRKVERSGKDPTGCGYCKKSSTGLEK